jgi:predicted outer membrane repeat protein
VNYGSAEIGVEGYGSRIFEVAAGVQATLAGLTIADGSGALGGFDPDLRGYDGLGDGILNFGTLTVRSCTLDDNHSAALVDGSDLGGGIYNASKATATVTGCTFSGNSAYQGGAIYNLGTLTVSGSTFAGSTAYQAATYGGGIYNASQATATVTGCTFSGNSAGEGGGIYNGSTATATVTGCTFSGDSATFSGGAIYVHSHSTVTVSTSAFSDNSPDNIFGRYRDKGGNTFS